MTLARQLLLIVSLMFLLIFIGTMTITLDNTRRYLITQLESHAQDTATSLGLSLSPHLAMEDTLLMESMVDAIFDRGYYREIVVEDIDGNPLISRQLPVAVEGVPEWFVHAMPLVTPHGEAKVMAGWRQGGKVRVVSHPGHAYAELWTNTVQTFWWSVGSLAFAMLVTINLLRRILAPLRAVEIQARAVADREFAQVENIPRTRELKSVVIAMNTMTAKVEEMLSENYERTERLREAAYVDTATGLANEAAFDRDLERLVTHTEEHAFGAIGFIHIGGLEEVNRERGYDGGDEFLRNCARRIAEVVNEGHGTTAHISGALFAILLADATRSSVPVIMQALVGALDAVRDTGPVHIGLAYYAGGQSAAVMKARAESALRNVQGDPASSWHMYVETETAAGRDIQHEDRWRQILHDVIDNKSVMLAFQVVKSPNLDRVIHYEVLARLRPSDDGDGNQIVAGVFFPMAARVGLTVELDRLIVSLTIEHLNQNPQHNFAVNLSRQAVTDAEFVSWLTERLQHGPAIAARLAFEVTEQIALTSPSEVVVLAQALRSCGASFGVDHCGARDIELKYMKLLKPDYSKVDGAFITALDTDAAKRDYVQSLVQFGHAFDVQTIAEFVETEQVLSVVKNIGFDGAQGHLIGLPADQP